MDRIPRIPKEPAAKAETKPQSSAKIETEPKRVVEYLRMLLTLEIEPGRLLIRPDERRTRERERKEESKREEMTKE